MEKFKLRGTLQDVKNMRDLLVEHFSFQPASILILAGKEMNGAMTYTFIRAIKENPNITYGGLLNYMHQSIVAANRGRCLPSLNLFNRKLEQDTVLSSSQDFDINQKLNLAVAGRNGAGWARRRWLGGAVVAGQGCGGWAWQRWLGGAVLVKRMCAVAKLGGGALAKRGGRAAVEVRQPVAVRGWKSGRGCEGLKANSQTRIYEGDSSIVEVMSFIEEAASLIQQITLQLKKIVQEDKAFLAKLEEECRKATSEAARRQPATSEASTSDKRVRRRCFSASPVFSISTAKTRSANSKSPTATTPASSGLSLLGPSN
nr:metacaspase-1-like isoform X2 [Ipomoea batatas]